MTCLERKGAEWWRLAAAGGSGGGGAGVRAPAARGQHKCTLRRLCAAWRSQQAPALAWRGGPPAVNQESARQGPEKHPQRGAASCKRCARLGCLRCHGGSQPAPCTALPFRRRSAHAKHQIRAVKCQNLLDLGPRPSLHASSSTAAAAAVRSVALPVTTALSRGCTCSSWLIRSEYVNQ